MPVFQVELQRVVRVTVSVEAEGLGAAVRAVREANPGFVPTIVDDCRGHAHSVIGVCPNCGGILLDGDTTLFERGTKAACQHCEPTASSGRQFAR